MREGYYIQNAREGALYINCVLSANVVRHTATYYRIYNMVRYTTATTIL